MAAEIGEDGWTASETLKGHRRRKRRAVSWPLSLSLCFHTAVSTADRASEEAFRDETTPPVRNTRAWHFHTPLLCCFFFLLFFNVVGGIR